MYPRSLLLDFSSISFGTFALEFIHLETNQSKLEKMMEDAKELSSKCFLSWDQLGLWKSLDGHWNIILTWGKILLVNCFCCSTWLILFRDSFCSWLFILMTTEFKRSIISVQELDLEKPKKIYSELFPGLFSILEIIYYWNIFQKRPRHSKYTYSKQFYQRILLYNTNEMK